MKVGFLYPTTETCRSVSIKLLKTGNEVVLFCPDDGETNSLAKSIIDECFMASAEQNHLRGKENSFSVEKYDLSDCDVIVIPWLDIKNKSDVDYSAMCLNLFRLMKSVGNSFSPSAKILFGHNVAGLAAAVEWGKVWPDTRRNIYVTCSVYTASQKMYGPAVRALPVERNPVRIINSSGQDCEEMNLMAVKWTHNSFIATESELFNNLIDLIKKNEPLEILGVVGKFCSTAESKKYGIRAGDVFWLPTDVLDSDWYEEILPHLKQSLKM